MTEVVASLADLAGAFDTIVLDQWGVLHDGSAPYPGAVESVAALKSSGVRVAVLSNSGKRANANAHRIADIGFDPAYFDLVMTSGEALWRDIEAGTVPARRFFPIERASGDAVAFFDGLDAEATDSFGKADAILLMGVPDDAAEGTFDGILADALAAGTPVICTNPDRASPRAGGRTVASPGALAHAHAEAGGDVRFYGKPHLPVFRAIETSLGTPGRIVMVGDSLEHDVAGAANAGWSSAFVRGGLHADAFARNDEMQTLAALAEAHHAPMPDFMLALIGGEND